MSKATEVMMQYVENLKRTYEKDHAELMEFKKLANQNSSRSCGPSGKNQASVLVVRSGPPWLGPQGSGQLRGWLKPLHLCPEPLMEPLQQLLQ